MIVSVSRRTDIPALYTAWFQNRLTEGYALTRNPMNPRQVRRISLNPQDVTGFVFWSKNPAPMLSLLPKLSAYRYYFQFTLTPYGQDLEPGLPDTPRRIETFRRLSDAVGPNRVIWRYDPVLLNGDWSVSRHEEAFDQMANALAGAASRATFSFIDPYAHLKAPMKQGVFAAPDEAQMVDLARSFMKSAKRAGMTLETCAEPLDLSALGIRHGCCVDASLFAQMGAAMPKFKKDPNQRPACGCAPSVDIGAYDTCTLGCRYCYANHSEARVRSNKAMHDPGAPLLVGALETRDTVRDRT